MIKDLLRGIARSSGFNISGIDHLGIELENDVGRLTAADPLKIIFDVGANVGQTTLALAHSFPQATVFSFEPAPATYAILEHSVRANKRIRAYQAALGSECGSIRLNLTPNSETATVRDTLAAVESVEVPLKTIDSVAEENGIPEICLLKIDAEGYEVPILNGARHLLEIGRIRFIYTECVFGQSPELPHTSFFELHELLERYGFCFVAYYAEAFELRHGSALGNVLYALRSRLPASAPGRAQTIFSSDR